MTLKKNEINLRIGRWTLELQNSDYSTEYRPGKRISHVDALNRASNILVIEDNTFEFNISVCQSQDPKIKELRMRLEKEQNSIYETRNGLLYWKCKDKILFYVPRAMEHELYKYPNDFGHLAQVKSLRYYETAIGFRI